MPRPNTSREPLLNAMPGTLAQLQAATGLHPQNVWRTVHALLLAEECHVCGMGEATGPRARPPYIFARGAPGPDALDPVIAKAKPRRRDLPKRDALTVGLFGRA